MPFLAELSSAPGVAGLHFAPLLAEVRIRWQFFPQSATGWIAAVLLAAACLASDWFFYQRRTGSRFFAKPQWSQLFQWRWTLADLLETVCLLSAVFLLSQFYWFAGTPNSQASEARYQPDAVLAAGLVVIGVLTSRSWKDQRQRIGRLAGLLLLGLLLCVCRVFHPAGALVSPLLVGLAIVIARQVNTLTIVTIVCAILAIAMQFVVLFQRELLFWHEGRPPISYLWIYRTDTAFRGILFASSFACAVSLCLGKRAGMYTLALAILCQRSVPFVETIYNYYEYNHAIGGDFLEALKANRGASTSNTNKG